MADAQELALAYQSGKIALRELVAVKIGDQLVKTTMVVFGLTFLPTEFDFINVAYGWLQKLNDLIVKSWKLPVVLDG